MIRVSKYDEKILRTSSFSDREERNVSEANLSETPQRSKVHEETFLAKRLSLIVARAWMGTEHSIELKFGHEVSQLVQDVVLKQRSKFLSRYFSYRLFFGDIFGRKNILPSTSSPEDLGMFELLDSDSDTDEVLLARALEERLKRDREALAHYMDMLFGAQVPAISYYGYFARSLERTSEAIIHRILARQNKKVFRTKSDRLFLRNWIRVFSRLNIDSNQIFRLKKLFQTQKCLSRNQYFDCNLWVTQDVLIRAQIINLLSRERKISYLSTSPHDPMLIDCVNSSGRELAEFVPALTDLIGERKRAINKAFYLQSPELGNRISYAVRLNDQIVILGVDPIEDDRSGTAAELYCLLRRSGLQISNVPIIMSDMGLYVDAAFGVAQSSAALSTSKSLRPQKKRCVTTITSGDKKPTSAGFLLGESART